jgi:hypothetical protein
MASRNDNIARILESDDCDNRIEALRDKARRAGDDYTVDVCNRALGDGCDDARRDAAGILADADRYDVPAFQY